MSASMGEAVGRAMRELRDREAAAAQGADREAEQLRHAIHVFEMAEVFVAWALSHGVRPDICDDNRQHLLALRRQREEHNARLSRRERRQGKELPLDDRNAIVVTTRTLVHPVKKRIRLLQRFEQRLALPSGTLSG